jgi:phospholipid/cholesterol/gamma-HCH transport system substrate-binding protein
LKRQEAREVIVGLVALVVLGAVLVQSYRSNRQSARLPDSGYRVSAVFNHVSGLAQGSPVQVAGIPVGAVEAITLLPDYRARMTMRIDPDIVLPKDTSAGIHTDGLFGGKFVVLEPGGDDATLADGSAIAFTQDAVVISRLLDLIISEGRAARTAAPAPARPDSGGT